jgi:hypothetical protein
VSLVRDAAEGLSEKILELIAAHVLISERRLKVGKTEREAIDDLAHRARVSAPPTSR